jgi:hypothetical protein
MDDNNSGKVVLNQKQSMATTCCVSFMNLTLGILFLVYAYKEELHTGCEDNSSVLFWV